MSGKGFGAGVGKEDHLLQPAFEWGDSTHPSQSSIITQANLVMVEVVSGENYCDATS